MTHLIKVEEREGKQLVSARELYDFLGLAPQHWSKWYNRNIIKNQFAVENNDYSLLTQWGSENLRGNKAQDFAITLDFAKKIAMMANTEKGNEARDYFIQCEKRVQSKGLTRAESLLENVRILVEQERKLNEHDNRLKILEAQNVTSPEYFTIAGYGSLNGVQVNIKMASVLGRNASRICKDRNYPIDQIPDPRFGTVNCYPKIVLEEVFNSTMITVR